MGWFEPAYTNRDLYVADYVKLYADTIYPALMSVDQQRVDSEKSSSARLQRAWVDSSPSNGLKSWDPYVKLWQQASTAEAGDVQYVHLCVYRVVLALLLLSDSFVCLFACLCVFVVCLFVCVFVCLLGFQFLFV